VLSYTLQLFLNLARAMPQGQSSLNRLFLLSGIFDGVIKCLVYDSLVNSAACNTYIQQSVKTELHLWFSQVICQHVGVDVMSFTDLIKGAGGIVCGSAALWILKSPCGWEPADLNVIVPLSTIHKLIQFFYGHDYVLVRTRTLDPALFPASSVYSSSVNISADY